jgi:hypothetical protein
MSMMKVTCDMWQVTSTGREAWGEGCEMLDAGFRKGLPPSSNFGATGASGVRAAPGHYEVSGLGAFPKTFPIDSKRLSKRFQTSIHSDSNRFQWIPTTF